jgi:hypothetical protein
VVPFVVNPLPVWPETQLSRTYFLPVSSATEGQQCQNPELVTSLFRINDVVNPKQNSWLDGHTTADFGGGSATSLNVGFDT